MAYVEVRAASLSIVNILAAPAALDGLTLSMMDRILLTNQTSQSQNGVWTFQGADNPLMRPTSMTDQYFSGHVLDNATQVWVTNGNTLAGTVWGIDTVFPFGSIPPQVITVDSTPHRLSQVALPSVQARVATTGNLNVAVALPNLPPPFPPNTPGLDGVPLQGNGGPGSDIILVKDQTDQTQNGVYWANTSGAQVRITEPLPPTRRVHVSAGDQNANTRYELVNKGAMTLGTTALTFALQERRLNVRDFGAKGDGVTDDSAAIQAVFYMIGKNYANVIGPFGLAGTPVTIYFPFGQYKITNQLVLEGTNAIGVRLLGDDGPGASYEGTALIWFGPLGGTMMLVLGTNFVDIEQLRFDPSPSGGGQAAGALWIDSTQKDPPYPSPSPQYSISSAAGSITRSGNVVTATLMSTPSPAIVSPNLVKVSGVADSTFDGVFRCLYSSGTTVSWLQAQPPGGSNSSSGGSLIGPYQSDPSSNIVLRKVGFGSAKAINVPVTSISGTYPTFSLTTSSAHSLNVGDLVIYKGGDGGDATYNAPYTVSAVGSSTTATLTQNLLGFGGQGASSSGGTLLTDATGLRLGHYASATSEVNTVVGYDLFFQGDQLGNSLAGVKADNGGNVKDFEFFNVTVNGYRYGFVTFISGNFSVIGYDGGLTTPDINSADFRNLASIDFLQCAPALIASAETEAVWNRFLRATANGAPVRLDSISYQGTPPDDDIVINCPNLVITGSQLFNLRSATSVPFIQLSNPLLGSPFSLVSLGNMYTNTTNPSGPSPGYIPVIDGPFGNVIHRSGGSPTYDGGVLNITSKGDQGTAQARGGVTTSLNPLDPIAGATYSFSWTAATIPNGSSTSVSFTWPVTGVVVASSVVTASYSNGVPVGVLMTASAVSANTVQVSFLNQSGGIVTLAAGTIRFIVQP